MNAPQRCIDGHNHIGVEMISYLRGDYPYAQMLPQLVDTGSLEGITDWVVFPMVTNLSLGLDGLRQGVVTTQSGMETTPYLFENRRMLEELHRLFPRYLSCVFPFVMGDPARRPDAQVDALRRLRTEYPFYGLKFQTTILQSPITALREGGRVLLDLAAEADLAVLIHSSVHPDDPWAQAADILDIVEAFPALRFCVAHSCRFDKPCLDRLAALPNAWFDCSAHRIHCVLAQEDAPQVAPPERRFASDYRRPERVLRDLIEAYPGKLIWGSDSPYQSFAEAASGLALFSTYAEEVACLRALPEPLQREASWDNPLRCFRLPVTPDQDEGTGGEREEKPV